jgi:Transcriptional regulators
MARYSQKRTNIADVAALAKVSTATVSKVLNAKDEHISVETRVRVMKAVEELSYVPNYMARTLKDHNSKTLGLVLPDISNMFPEMAQGAEDEASLCGYNIFFCSTNSNPIQEEKCIKMLVSKMVDGIIYISSNFETGANLLNELPIPCVAIDRFITNNKKIGAVLIDNYQAMKDVAKFLVKNDCKRIGYVTADISQAPCEERFKGLVDGLAECGVNFDKKLLHTGVFSVETGYVGAMNLLQRAQDIDCIACGNDLIALGVMNVCQKMHKLIPKDIKIIGFDNIYIAKYLNPELTTVDQNGYIMGKTAAQMLINHVEHGKPLETVVLKHELIQRGTV